MDESTSGWVNQRGFVQESIQSALKKQCNGDYGNEPDREKRVPEGQIGKLRLKGKYLEDCRKSVNAVERQD